MRTPTAPGHVDPGLDRDDHAGGQRGLALLGQPRPLVDVEPDAVAQPVAEVLGVAGGVDDRARDGVDLAAGGPRAHGRERRLLGLEHQLVDLAVARVDVARRVGARAVRGVAVELRAPVDDAQRAGGDRHVARRGVRQRPVLAGRHDRRERRRLRPMRRIVNSRSRATSRSVRPTSPRPRTSVSASSASLAAARIASSSSASLTARSASIAPPAGTSSIPARSMPASRPWFLTLMWASSKASRRSPEPGRPLTTPASRSTAISRSQAGSTSSADCVR